MLLSTEDVNELQHRFDENEFTREQFISSMQSLLHGRIQDEVEFVIQCNDLFEAIDINGDGLMVWSEFSKYMVDAGEARIASMQEYEQRIRKYKKLSWNADKPIATPKRPIDCVVFLQKLDAIAMLETLADEVHVYSFRHKRDDPPRLMSTIRHYTSFESHRVHTMYYITTRNLLVTSSCIKRGAYLSFWDLSRLTVPVLVQRVAASAIQTSLLWSQGAQMLVTASNVVDPVDARKNFLNCWDLNQFALAHSFRLHMGQVQVLVEATVEARAWIVSGSSDGTIVVYDPELKQVIGQLDAHESGVKGMTHSAKYGYLASFGHTNTVQEYRLRISIWKLADTMGKLSTTLSGHAAFVRHRFRAFSFSFLIPLCSWWICVPSIPKIIWSVAMLKGIFVSGLRAPLSAFRWVGPTRARSID